MKFCFLNFNKKSLKIFSLLLFPIFFLVLFFYIPIINIVKFAFFKGSSFSLSNLLHVLTDSYTVRVMAFTFKEAFVSAFVTLIVALPGAYIISHFRFRLKNTLVSLSTIPFILPSVLVALGFIILFGRNGFVSTILLKIVHRPINLLYSFWGIILVHVFYNFPIPLRIIGTTWDGLPKKYSFAAFSLGANRIQTFFKVTLPLLLPAVISSFTLVFMFCFLSFVIILVIGGARFATLEVSIYTYYNMFFDYSTGSALALIQAVFTFLFVYIYMKTGNFVRRSEERKEFKQHDNLFKTPKTALLSIVYLLFVFPVIFLPLIVIFVNAFLKPYSYELTLTNFARLFSGEFNYITSVNTLRIILNSLYFAVFATVFSVIFAILISYAVAQSRTLKDFFIAFLMLPLAVSPVTIGFAYILTFRNISFILNSWLIIAVAHTVIAFPFALKTLHSSVERMPKSMVYAAESLGMSRIKAFFSVDLPLLKNSIIVSSVFTFAISLGEFGATFMLYRNRYITMPVALYRFLAGRHFGAASAMGAILSVFALLIFLVIDRIKKEVSPI